MHLLAVAATLPTFFRVTHGFDPVPHLPLEAMGFHHVATEVYYNELQTKHTVCNGSGEDGKCSNKVICAPAHTRAHARAHTRARS